MADPLFDVAYALSTKSSLLRRTPRCDTIRHLWPAAEAVLRQLSLSGWRLTKRPPSRAHSTHGSDDVPARARISLHPDGTDAADELRHRGYLVDIIDGLEQAFVVTLMRETDVDAIAQDVETALDNAFGGDDEVRFPLEPDDR